MRLTWRQTGLRPFDWLTLRTMRGFARVWHRSDSNGPAPLPATGPAIIVANHPTHADPCFLLAASPRPMHFLHAQEYCNVPILRHLFRWIGCIPVARNGHDLVVFRTALDCLASGEILCIFPEGDISPAGGGFRRPKRGAAFLALESRVPVIPARISGTAPVRGIAADWLVPSHGVHVAFGGPIDLSPYYHQPIRSRLLTEVSKVLMKRIAELPPAAVFPPHQRLAS
jgi:1-acyl-sn-glycerol-3-phosphate acyltransferase